MSAHWKYQKVKSMSKCKEVFYECEKCKDENAIMCPHCNGEGENPDVENGVGLLCDFCEGEGEILCPDCKDGRRG
jgi:DnaJ-class molecular chaperone